MALGQRELDLLMRYAELVRQWNQRINLVSRKDIGNLVSGHIVDSLAGVPVLERLLAGDPAGKAVSLESQARGHSRDDTAPPHPPSTAGIPDRKSTSDPRPLKVMDLGSGGGLPGIPLKICLPYVDLTLVESTKKKSRFLEAAVRELGLEGVTVIDRHSKELEKDPDHRGRYDLVLARAVAELKDLLELAFPFLKDRGRLIAFKGARAGEEVAGAISVLKRLQGTFENTDVAMVSKFEQGKQFIIIRKIG